MPLERVKVSPYQRTADADFNAAGSLAISNLALAMRAFVQREAGVSVGGGVFPDVGRFCKIEPTAAVDGSGNLLVLESATQIGEFAANNSGNDRIDLVSLGYTAADSSVASRVFVNPANGETYTSSVPTRVTGTTAPTITTGVAGSNPATPATPAGHVALATVRIPSGTSTITSGMITPVHASFQRPMRQMVQADVTAALPWESNLLYSLTTPPGKLTLLIAQVAMQRPTIAFKLSLLNKTTSAEIAATVYPPQGAGIEQPEPMQLITAIAGGISGSTRDIAIRVAPNSGSTGAVTFALKNISLVAVTL